MNRPVRLIASVSDPPPLQAQVQHHGVDALGLEVVEDAADVAGGALVVGHAAAGAVHVHVEAGQVDHADLVRLAVGLAADVEDLAAGLAVLQLDLRRG